jgi:hypothetical protein
MLSPTFTDLVPVVYQPSFEGERQYRYGARGAGAPITANMPERPQ